MELRHKEGALKRIVFLDRDGTLIRHVPYLHDPAKVQVLDGVAEGLSRLREAGFQLVMVTNQQGIALGYFTTEDFHLVNGALFRALSARSVTIDSVYFCAHSVTDKCSCRKPGPLLLERAMAHYEAQPGDCWMIGDAQSDIAAGEAAGCRAILVNSGVSASAHSFSQAVETILNAPRRVAQR